MCICVGAAGRTLWSSEQLYGLMSMSNEFNTRRSERERERERSTCRIFLAMSLLRSLCMGYTEPVRLSLAVCSESVSRANRHPRGMASDDDDEDGEERIDVEEEGERRG